MADDKQIVIGGYVWQRCGPHEIGHSIESVRAANGDPREVERREGCIIKDGKTATATNSGLT